MIRSEIFPRSLAGLEEATCWERQRPAGLASRMAISYGSEASGSYPGPSYSIDSILKTPSTST